MRRLLGAIAALALVTGCGVAVEDRPRSVDPEDVPFGLLDESPVTTTTTALESAPTAEVFLVIGDRLVGVRRSVAGAMSLQARLDALLEGPSEQEARLGLSTALPVGGDLASEVRGDTARIDFGDAFIPDLEQVVAIAQLVFTATALDRVDRVLFFVGGRPVDVPAQDGTLRSEALTRRDFALFAPS